MKNEPRFNSEVWWPHIEQLADSFVDYINKEQTKKNSKMKICKLKKWDEVVKNTYYKNLLPFKKGIYGKNVSENRIDRHKIIALYIKSFLEVSPFYVENLDNRNSTETLICPNEHFSLQFMYLILMAWNKKKCKIRMQDNEKKWFIILLNHFRLNINKLDVLSLSQIIYYIEDKYVNREKG